jgi:hypothetical protein
MINIFFLFIKKMNEIPNIFHDDKLKYYEMLFPKIFNIIIIVIVNISTYFIYFNYRIY